MIPTSSGLDVSDTGDGFETFSWSLMRWMWFVGRYTSQHCEPDTLEPDEYDRALYRIEASERARLAETLGRVRLESPAY